MRLPRLRFRRRRPMPGPPGPMGPMGDPGPPGPPGPPCPCACTTRDQTPAPAPEPRTHLAMADRFAHAQFGKHPAPAHLARHREPEPPAYHATVHADGTTEWHHQPPATPNTESLGLSPWLTDALDRRDRALRAENGRIAARIAAAAPDPWRMADTWHGHLIAAERTDAALTMLHETAHACGCTLVKGTPRAWQRTEYRAYALAAATGPTPHLTDAAIYSAPADAYGHRWTMTTYDEHAHVHELHPDPPEVCAQNAPVSIPCRGRVYTREHGWHPVGYLTGDADAAVLFAPAHTPPPTTEEPPVSDTTDRHAHLIALSTRTLAPGLSTRDTADLTRAARTAMAACGCVLDPTAPVQTWNSPGPGTEQSQRAANILIPALGTRRDVTASHTPRYVAYRLPEWHPDLHLHRTPAEGGCAADRGHIGCVSRVVRAPSGDSYSAVVYDPSYDLRAKHVPLPLHSPGDRVTIAPGAHGWANLTDPFPVPDDLPATGIVINGPDVCGDYTVRPADRSNGPRYRLHGEFLTPAPLPSLTGTTASTTIRVDRIDPELLALLSGGRIDHTGAPVDSAATADEPDDEPEGTDARAARTADRPPATVRYVRGHAIACTYTDTPDGGHTHTATAVLPATSGYVTDTAVNNAHTAVSVAIEHEWDDCRCDRARATIDTYRTPGKPEHTHPGHLTYTVTVAPDHHDDSEPEAPGTLTLTEHDDGTHSHVLTAPRRDWLAVGQDYADALTARILAAVREHGCTSSTMSTEDAWPSPDVSIIVRCPRPDDDEDDEPGYDCLCCTERTAAPDDDDEDDDEGTAPALFGLWDGYDDDEDFPVHEFPPPPPLAPALHERLNTYNDRMSAHNARRATEAAEAATEHARNWRQIEDQLTGATLPDPPSTSAADVDAAAARTREALTGARRPLPTVDEAAVARARSAIARIDARRRALAQMRLVQLTPTSLTATTEGRTTVRLRMDGLYGIPLPPEVHFARLGQVNPT